MKYVKEKAAVLKRISVRRYIAQLLILSIVLTGITPANTRYAAETNNWKADYFDEVNDAIPLSNDDELMRFDVKKGDLVGIGMELSERQTKAGDRFMDTFHIDLPQPLYEAFVDYNNDNIDYFMPSELTDSRYLMNVTADADINLASSGNASPGNASSSNAKHVGEGYQRLSLFFVDQFRKNTELKNVHIEPTEDVLYFVAPANMQLILKQEGNNCRIEIDSPINKASLKRINPATATIEGKLYAAGNIDGSDPAGKWWDRDFNIIMYLDTWVESDVIMYEGIDFAGYNSYTLPVRIDQGPADVKFENIQFYQDGIYDFTIRQDYYWGDPLFFDDAYYYVSVNVSENLSKVEVSYFVSQEDGSRKSVDEMVWINTNTAISIEAIHEYTFGTEGQFYCDNFKFIAKAGGSYEGLPDELVAETYGSGLIEFPVIPLKDISTSGGPVTYVYKVQAVDEKKPGINYSDEIYTYEISYDWSKNSDVTIEIKNKAGQVKTDMVFVQSERIAWESFKLTKELYDQNNDQVMYDIPKFEFELSLVQESDPHNYVVLPEDKIVSNDYYGKIKFDQVLFTGGGEFEFVVKELPREKGNFITDPGEVHIKVTVDSLDMRVTDTVYEKIAKSKMQAADSGEVFKNTMKGPMPAYAELQFVKNLVGKPVIIEARMGQTWGQEDDWNDTERFTFELTLLSDVDDDVVISNDKVLKKGSSVQMTTEVTNHTNWLSFKPIEFYRDGEYFFSIKEIADEDKKDVIFDPVVYYAKVIIIEDEEGILRFYDTIYYGNEKAEDEDIIDNYDVRFVNTKTYFQFKMKKQLFDKEGNLHHLKGKEFEFQAVTEDEIDGLPEILTAENDENGDVIFELVPWRWGEDFGEVSYKITERDKGEPGIQYSSDEYLVTLSFNSHNEGNKLEIRIKKDGVEVSEEEVIFTNRTDHAIGEFTLQKQLLDADNNSVTVIPEYHFDLSLAGNPADHSNVIMPQDTVAVNDQTGQIQFNRVYFKTVGTYRFVVREINKTDSGITYDDGEVRIMVTVIPGPDSKPEISDISYEKYESNQKVSDNNETGRRFINKIKEDTPPVVPTYDSFTLEAGKTLDDKKLTDQEFMFYAQLIYTDTSADLYHITAKNNEDGLIRFPQQTLQEEGIYIFAINEIDEGKTGITYDDAVYYARVKVTKENNSSHYRAPVEYYSYYNEINHEVSGSVKKPEFNNIYTPERITIEKVAASNGQVLGGAVFELSARLINGGDTWTILDDNLVTAGGDGRVSAPLPEEYWNYQYKMIEKQAPTGYSKSRVGTTTFKVNTEGDIIDLIHDGTAGYVTLAADGQILKVKNHKPGGGGGSTPDPTQPPKVDPTQPTNPTDPTQPTDPTDPTLPTIVPDPDTPRTPYTPGDPVPEGKQVVMMIDDDGVPRAYLIDIPVPKSGLAKTGDTSVSVVQLVTIMFGVTGLAGLVIYMKRRDESINR